MKRDYKMYSIHSKTESIWCQNTMTTTIIATIAKQHFAFQTGSSSSSSGNDSISISKSSLLYFFFSVYYFLFILKYSSSIEIIIDFGVGDLYSCPGTSDGPVLSSFASRGVGP